MNLCIIPLIESTKSGKTSLCCWKLRWWLFILGNSDQKGAIRATASGVLEVFYFLIRVLVTWVCSVYETRLSYTFVCTLRIYILLQQKGKYTQMAKDWLR